MWCILQWLVISSRATVSGWRVPSSLIVGSTRRTHFDKVVCVSAPVAVRLQRIMQRDHISQEKAQQWIDAVMPQEELIARSDYEIVNDGVSDVEAQVVHLLDLAQSIR